MALTGPFDRRKSSAAAALVAIDRPRFVALASKLGHRIIGTTTGTGAIQLAAAAQPDLIVLDVGFPDADGRDVLAGLKADTRTARIPVLVWSGCVFRRIVITDSTAS